MQLVEDHWLAWNRCGASPDGVDTKNHGVDTKNHHDEPRMVLPHRRVQAQHRDLTQLLQCLVTSLLNRGA